MIAAIDPGREKFGVALCRGRELAASAICPISMIDEVARAIAGGDLSIIAPMIKEGDITACEKKESEPSDGRARVSSVVIGSGTGSSLFRDAFARAGAEIFFADERGTTLAARSLYWKLHPPRGLARIIPISLRVPPRPIDDLAAWAIALRWMDQSAAGASALISPEQ